MTRYLVTIGMALLALAVASPAAAQTIGDVFRQVFPSTVVIHARGSEVSPRGGRTTFTETGSGLLVSPDGKVMTAAHVVNAMDDITVTFASGDKIPARVVNLEPGADLALLQADRVPAGTPVGKLGNSDQMRIGDQVIIVGAPYGLSYSLTVGHLSARHAPGTIYGAFPLAEFLQTDAPINTGNSGGPMFNMAGEAIGVVSHIISKSGGSEGLGFVVSMNAAQQLILGQRGFYAGLEVQPVTGDLAAFLNLPQAVGMLVKTVAKDSPAAQAGLRGGNVPATIGGKSIVLGGDIILSIAGLSADPAEFAKVRHHLATLPDGTSYTVKILREGKIVELKAKR
jgi:S1-C subfamily serine protease